MVPFDFVYTLSSDASNLLSSLFIFCLLYTSSTVDDLLAELGLGRDEAKLVFVEHAARPGNHILQDGRKAAIFPPVAGG